MSSATKILTRVDQLTANGAMAMVTTPVRPQIQACIDAGLLSASKVRCGPLGLYTGEVLLKLTDDGRKLLPFELNS